MKRSEINEAIRGAQKMFRLNGFTPPPWSFWSRTEWQARPQTARYCARHQMGWDITDFGSGSFMTRGLLLLCTRNGIQGAPNEPVYAEKIMVTLEGQETPFHYHKVKMEDIIVRGGGKLVVEFINIGHLGETLDTPVNVLVDGSQRRMRPREPLVLTPGESVTIRPWQMHRFYGKAGSGDVLVGEVSQVNDDINDNFFLEKVGRFATIVEDEKPKRPLWSELSALVG